MDRIRRILSSLLPDFKSKRNTLIFARDLRDVKMTLLAFLYAFTCFFIVCLGNAIADRINPNNLVPMSQRRPLPDMIIQLTHGWFLRSGLPENLSDRLVGAAALMMFLRPITMFEKGCTIFRRAFYVMGSAYALRAITVVVTVLPNPLVTCKSEPYEPLLYDAFQLLMMKRVSCGDVFFSGHSILFTLCGAIWVTYSSNRLLRTVAMMIAAAGATSLVISAYHYTIDVLAGCFVTAFFWAMYHRMLLRNQHWFGRIVRWLDDSRTPEGDGEEMVMMYDDHVSPSVMYVDEQDRNAPLLPLTSFESRQRSPSQQSLNIDTRPF